MSLCMSEQRLYRCLQKSSDQLRQHTPFFDAERFPANVEEIVLPFALNSVDLLRVVVRDVIVEFLAR